MAAKTTTSTIQVLVVDDHRTVAEAIRDAVGRAPDVTARAAYSGEEALEVIERRRPNVILMDISMPGIGGIEATKRITQTHSDVKVVMLSAHEDDLVKGRALEAGALGYLSKISPMNELVDAVHRAVEGKPLIDEEEVERLQRRLRKRRSQDATEKTRVNRLSARETEVLQLMADGVPAPEIAERLSISQNTLRTHTQNILLKLGVHSKVEAIVMGIRQGKVTART